MLQKNSFGDYFRLKFTVKTLVTAAMLLAAFVVLDYFSLKIGDGIKFNFGFFPVALCGALFGPVWTMLLGVAGDLIGCIVSGNAPLWQLTLTAGLQGLIYAILLYKQTGKRLIIGAVIARLLDTAVISLWLNTQILISVGFVSNTAAGYTTRLIKAGIELPLYLVILIFVLPRVIDVYNRVVLRNKSGAVPETGIEETVHTQKT
ncbi:MAG: folate family ECF transporter S component [Ruminococcus sp.]|jgi:ECF transporter S component (folate family)|nr:folate family ECF transporter S component [Ruminococcus sp.]